MVRLRKLLKNDFHILFLIRVEDWIWELDGVIGNSMRLSGKLMLKAFALLFFLSLSIYDSFQSYILELSLHFSTLAFFLLSSGLL